MAGVCPWCQEPLSFTERRLASCPHCERPLAAAGGQEVRPIDLRADEVEAAQHERFRKLLIWGGGVVAAVSLIMPLLHIGVAIGIPLLLIVHMIAVRLVLIRDARRLLGTTRRIFNRWIIRFSFVWVGIPGYGLTTVPVLGVVAGVVTFGGLTALAHYYTLWGLERERQRQQLAVWETALLTGFVVLTVVVIALAIALALLLGFSVAWLTEVIQLES